ncbi:MAG TPA: site-2 protease family protein [Longimicrobium sp.]|nr:site-2 protease family protein [Longimicrobium sp.]
MRIGDQEIVFGPMVPTLRPDDPEVAAALAGWPGSHWLSRVDDGWELTLARRVRPRPRERWWLHALLLALTLVTTTLAGAYLADHDPLRLVEAHVVGADLLAPSGFSMDEAWPGLAFSLPMLSVLLAHELGHYVVGRRHGIDVSPPYFIPAPFFLSLIGTFGAFIRLRSPLLHRRMLMAMGAAGPLVGFAVALPVALVGLALSPSFAGSAPPPGSGNLVVLGGEPLLQLGDSLLWRLMALAAGPGGDAIQLHPVAIAGWVGCFFTAVTLIPVGQLDGGHVVFALWRRAHQRVATGFLVALLVLGWWWQGWWVWGAMMLVLGRGRLRHPPVWDARVPLTRAQQAMGWACVVLFFLTFAPVPFR